MKTTFKIMLVAGAAMGFSGSTMAADLYSQAAPIAAPVMEQAPTASTWAGPYAGLQVGHAWGTVDSNLPDSADVSGWTLGGQVGYNFYLDNNIVMGAEGDLNWTNQEGTFASGDTYKKDWEGSARARLGYDLDGIMPYAEAGIAFAKGTVDSGPASFAATHTGWTAGAGVEMKLADQVSANAEYRYTDYGEQDYGAGSDKLTDNSLRLGVNYHF
ncbi:MAG TPA: outer membrane protein [Devosiaceae bacterium]|jgi:outer membrane autotransporter protein